MSKQANTVWVVEETDSDWVVEETGVPWYDLPKRAWDVAFRSHEDAVAEVGNVVESWAEDEDEDAEALRNDLVALREAYEVWKASGSQDPLVLLVPTRQVAFVVRALRLV